jgi:hypothetical protein
MLKKKVSGEIPRATAGGSLFGGGGECVGVCGFVGSGVREFSARRR